MSKSGLTQVTVPAKCIKLHSRTKKRKKVCKITVHHMAGVLTAEQCGKIFPSTRQTSKC